jgi:hypothetical protein
LYKAECSQEAAVEMRQRVNKKKEEVEEKLTEFMASTTATGSPSVTRDIKHLDEIETNRR